MSVSETYGAIEQNIPARKASASSSSSPATVTATSRENSPIWLSARALVAFMRLVSAGSFGPASCARELGVPGTASAGSALAYAVVGVRARLDLAAMRWALGVMSGMVVRMVGVRGGVDWAVVVREGVRGTALSVARAVKSEAPSSHADEEGGGSAGPDGRVWAAGRACAGADEAGGRGAYAGGGVEVATCRV